MPHRRTTARLIGPYISYLIAGAMLTIYQPPSLVTLASAPLVVIWHAVLLGGAVLGLYGGARRREVLELLGLVLICGPLVAYIVILGLAGGQSVGPGRFATWGIAALIAAGATFAAERAVALWLDVRDARRAHLAGVTE
jgi:hypothetical protein